VRFADLTYQEIAEAAASGAVGVVPMGCTEQQGPHLPVGFDSMFAEAVCVAAADHVTADGVTAIVTPTLPFGPTPEHRSFGAGFIDLPRDVQDAVLDATLRSLADQGFASIVVWRGCGEHRLHEVVRKFDAARVVLPELPYHGIWCRLADPTIPGGHADSFTTSIALHLWPDLVRLDLVPQEPSQAPDWDDPDLDFARYSRTGVVGDATHASAELGAVLFSASVEAAADVLRSAT
jgi:creatinine amidohydrolase